MKEMEISNEVYEMLESHRLLLQVENEKDLNLGQTVGLLIEVY